MSNVSFTPYFNHSDDTLLETASESGDIVTDSLRMLSELNRRYARTLLPYTAILGIFGVVGVVGNILVFVIYGCGKKFKDKKFRYYVLSLALIDFVTSVTCIPAEMVKHRSYFYFTERSLCKMKCFMNVFAAAAASYCLTMVAVDRYILTCRPLMFSKVPALSHSITWRLCVLMLVFAVLTSVPAAVLCGITTDTITDNAGNNITVYVCETEPRYAMGVSRYIYRIALCGLQVIVSLLMIVLYARIGLTVSRAMKIREEMDTRDIQMYDYRTHGGPRPKGNHYHGPVVNCRPCHHHHHIPTNIKLLFIVTVVFIVTYVLYVSLSWIDQTRLTQSEFLVFSMFYRSYFIHSIINPFLYVKMDKHFRKRCKEIVCSVLCMDKTKRICYGH